jgi:hypothetical protein
VFVVRDISEAQINLIDLFAKAVGAQLLKHGQTRSLNSAFDTIKQWWNGLPAVAKVVSLYDKDRQSRLNDLKNLMNGLSGSVDRFDFMLEQLPGVYKGSPVGDALTKKEAETIGEAFAGDVKLLNSGEQAVNGQVSKAVCEVYGAEGDMIECENEVTKWYANLNPSQRDPHKCDHEDATHFLTRLADESISFNTKIVKLLPNDYGFGAVSEWTSLHIKDYTSKLKQAKAEIDKAKPVVFKPIVDEGKKELRETEKVWAKIPEGVSALIFTTDGTDPRISNNAQKVTTDTNLSELLKNRSNVKIKIRAMDNEGNYSDAANLELVSKERKYQIQENLIGEATFKCPNDTDGVVAVLKSVISYGVNKKILNTDKAQQLEALLNDIVKDK